MNMVTGHKFTRRTFLSCSLQHWQLRLEGNPAWNIRSDSHQSSLSWDLAKALK